MEFKLHSQYQPTGDQPQAIDALVRGVEVGHEGAGTAGRYRLGQDIHYGQRDCAPAAPGARARAQQDAGRTVVPRSSANSFPKTQWATLCRITTIISPRHTSPHPIPISKRTRPLTTRSTVCATARPHALSERRDVIIVASVSCIYCYGRPGGIRRTWSVSLRDGHAARPRRASKAPGRNSVRAQRLRIRARYVPRTRRGR